MDSVDSFHRQTKVRVQAVQGFLEKYRSAARMIFPKTACGPTLLSRPEHGVTFACGNELYGIYRMIPGFLLLEKRKSGRIFLEDISRTYKRV